MARIGMVSIWFHRGQTMVTRTLRQALLDLGHEVFVFARQGSVWGQPMHETTGDFDIPNRFDHPTYQISPGTLRGWARYQRLDAVVMNEEYDHSLALALRQDGRKVVHYMDFLGQDWRPYLRYYDALWTATHRTEAILQEWGKGAQTHFIGWGVPPESFGETTPQTGESYDYAHNAGWLGINLRKGTDLVLRAFRCLQKDGVRPSALVHSQVSFEDYLQMDRTGAIVYSDLFWRHETVPPPGLYHLGRICIQPSRLEGLGLSVVEAMAAGRPVITTDAAPMHEFVTPETGWLVPVAEWRQRQDPIVFPEAHVSVEGLAKAMQEALLLPAEQLQAKAAATLARARTLFDWETFKGRLAEGLGLAGVA